MDTYQKFYTEYRDKLFNYLLFKCGDGDIALDVMQDSFVRHLQHYGESSANNPSLLYTIARNRLTDYLRGRPRMFRGLSYIKPEQAGRSEESSLIIKEDVSRVLRAVRSLPELDQEILVLATGGTSYKEIATIVGTSVANVKVRIHRARRKLLELTRQEEP